MDFASLFCYRCSVGVCSVLRFIPFGNAWNENRVNALNSCFSHSDTRNWIFSSSNNCYLIDAHTKIDTFSFGLCGNTENSAKHTKPKRFNFINLNIDSMRTNKYFSMNYDDFKCNCRRREFFFSILFSFFFFGVWNNILQSKMILSRTHVCLRSWPDQDCGKAIWRAVVWAIPLFCYTADPLYAVLCFFTHQSVLST